MRTWVGAAVAVTACALLAGCSKTRDCKAGTAFVTLQFGSAVDRAKITVTVDNGTSASTDKPISGRTATLELQFGGGYQVGNLVTVEVIAYLNQQEVGRGTSTMPLLAGCTPFRVSVGATGDLAGLDDLASSDLAAKQKGDPCSPGDNCATGFCVDGRCCDSDCTDQCAACDVPGKEGTCTPVNGNPHSSRLPCTGVSGDPCAGSCDGVNPAACDYPTGSCPPDASCTGGVGTLQGTCNLGVCTMPQVACADKLCGSTACQTVSQVMVGIDHGCVLLSDSTVRCWGANDSGQLGFGTTDAMTHLPSPVPGLGSVLQLANGGEHTCALLSDHTVRCWGLNFEGELGLGFLDGVAHPSPAPVCASGTSPGCPPLTNVNYIATGYRHSCAVVGSIVKCWGDNAIGSIGDGTDANQRNTPTDVCESVACANPLGASGGGPDELALSIYTSCALWRSSGTVLCWGRNASGECGQPTATDHFNTPQTVNGIEVGNRSAVHIAGGQGTICAVISDGTDPANNMVRCWGDSSSGQRGDSTNGFGPTPTSVCTASGCGTLLTGATSIATSGYTSCATANGGVWCWGENNRGQGATGTINAGTNVAVPTLLTSGAVEVGSFRSDTICARINSGGTLRCWGAAYSGVLGDGINAASPSPSPIPQKW